MDSTNQDLDRKKILQFLLPAGAVAAVVMLIGILVAMGDSGSTASTAKGQPGATEDFSLFPRFSLTGPEWKPVAEPGFPNLKYWDVKEGTGDPVPSGANVTINYTGWLVDGTKFDSSADHGGPANFGLGGLIPGWQGGIPGMKPGGTRRLLIPSHLGYGDVGQGKIPGKATLVFEIEMISFK